MLIQRPADIPSSEITPKSVYLQRRQFIQNTLGLGALALLPEALQAKSSDFPCLKKSPYSTSETPTPYDKVTNYNNFYEFGSSKSAPALLAKYFKTTPWSVRIDGAVEKPGTYTLEDILKPHTLEERIYRLRCVEAWSMVIPWVGFPLADLLKRFGPTANAKYVAFETLHDPEQMPGQKSRFSLDWPYVEGLRMDEAMHPLTILAVGLYGETLPKQNGAPLRLVVPWKYGFKSIKSIVRIHFTETRPATTWGRMGPDEYGFYANVNPAVDHPRWSQKTERKLGGGFFSSLFKQETRFLNGYAEQVGHLYAGMDLSKAF
ncbi:protein-methionine-sulfoxide reductase catalytic subunit MsrP [Candidatus Venteria ishoeyi]|uniref:protein-methionine-sulfoxide reductase catalytic subunit MsrP n=1 Tax=Candidatus Venteria ishoeyi TaxID=1899563 RepID=UPI0025A5466B|nr:protein-methionine-sulfoxide reductase catalytic subunit MsrP [Candidatus Venteria ishoeyi]MDM8545595.1 protein-methionine-sulfoxide reductase catalytic subunit MsrP [Candidatus Venteria ishoeyi]